MTATGTATFFLSTGRCGTQAIHNYLKSIVSDAVVVHEPIGPFYYPRITLGDFNVNQAGLEIAHRHFQGVIQGVEDGVRIIEAGWTGFTWLSHYKNSLGEKFGYFHLVRNPFKFAASLSTHHFYLYNPNTKRPLNDYTTYAAIHPSDKNALFPEVNEYWDKYNLFDKCLYQWLEINGFAKKLKSQNIFPLATIRYEDLFFNESAKDHLLKLLGCEANNKKIEFRDAFHNTSTLSLKPSCDYLCGKAIQMATELGYEVEALQSSIERLDYSRPRNTNLF